MNNQSRYGHLTHPNLRKRRIIQRRNQVRPIKERQEEEISKSKKDRNNATNLKSRQALKIRGPIGDIGG